MEHDIPKETLYAILIAASLDENSAFYGKDPGWMEEIDCKEKFSGTHVDISI